MNTRELIERVRAACNGHPHAKIAWPHRILHEAADALSSQAAEIEKLRAVLTDTRAIFTVKYGTDAKLLTIEYERHALWALIPVLDAALTPSSNPTQE